MSDSEVIAMLLQSRACLRWNLEREPDHLRSSFRKTKRATGRSLSRAPCLFGESAARSSIDTYRRDLL